MPVSFAGLDLSFMKQNPLPEHMKAARRTQPRGPRSDVVASPYFMADIKPFVSPVGRKPEVISSRPQLKAHERQHNCHQIGNDFGEPGAIGERNEAKKAKLIERASGKGVSVEWV